MTHNFVETNAMIEGRERGTEEQSPGSSVANPRGTRTPSLASSTPSRVASLLSRLNWPASMRRRVFRFQNEGGGSRERATRGEEKWLF